jgi:hypothetical protein
MDGSDIREEERMKIKIYNLILCLTKSLFLGYISKGASVKFLQIQEEKVQWPKRTKAQPECEKLG